MAITDWRPVAIPGDAPLSVQTAFQQLNTNGRLLSECQQAALADMSMPYVAATATTTPDIAGKFRFKGYYYHWQTGAMGPWFKHDSPAYYLWYYGPSGGNFVWYISNALGSGLTKKYWSKTAADAAINGAYVASADGDDTTIGALSASLPTLSDIMAYVNSILARQRTLGLIAT